MKTISQQPKRIVLREIQENAKKNDMLGTAIAVSKLNSNFEMSAKNIQLEMQKIGIMVSLPHIYNYLRLAKLPPKIRAYIKADRINPTDVLGELHKHQSDVELIKIIDKMVAEREKQSHNKMQTKKQERVQTLQNKIMNLFPGATISQADIKRLTEITGKYAIA